MLKIDIGKLPFLLIVLTFLALPIAASALTISGTIRDNNSALLPNVAIQMYSADGNIIGIYKDTTDAAGFYSISAVDPGIYDISFRPRTSTGLIPVYMENITINSDMTLNLTLQAGNYLSGTVTDFQGNGILDVDLNVYDSTGYKLFTPSDNTDDTGFYEIVLPSGTFTIAYRYRGSIQNPRYVPVELIGVLVSGDTTVDVTLVNGYFISGTVRNPNNAPVVDADLDARDVVTGLKVYTPNDNTDINGNYQMLVPAGTYEVNVAPLPINRLLPAIVYNFVVSNDAALDFNLLWGYLLSGTVRNPDGTAIFNAQIDITDASTGFDLFTPWNNSDSAGFYQVVVPTGLFNIDFNPPVGTPPYTACLRMHNQNITGDLVINPTVPWGILLSGLVRNQSAQGILNVDIDIINPSNSESLPLVGDHTDINGYFATAVAPGTYHIEIEPSKARRLTAKKLYDQLLNSDTYIPATLDTGMVVNGLVSDSDGAPFHHVHASAYINSSGFEIYTPGNSTDSLGLYTILIPPENYNLVYRPDTSYGIPDTVRITNIPVAHDTTINIQFQASEPDTIPPVVAVLSPNGGEEWAAYSQQLISWNATDNINVTSISIFLSTTGPGGPFSQIAAGEGNDGLFTWTVNPTETTNAYIRIIAYDGSSNSAEDISNAAFTIYIAQSSCDYAVGDVNQSGGFNGLDVVYSVNYFKGGAVPPYSCECTPGNTWFVTGDVNGSCTYNGLDVTYMVGFLKGGPGMIPCGACPPAG